MIIFEALLTKISGHLRTPEVYAQRNQGVQLALDAIGGGFEFFTVQTISDGDVIEHKNFLTWKQADAFFTQEAAKYATKETSRKWVYHDASPDGKGEIKAVELFQTKPDGADDVLRRRTVITKTAMTGTK